jgi:hypothetical protein
MTSIRTRPRFKIISNLSQEELKERIKKHLRNNKDSGVVGHVFDIHCSFDIAENRHFWSPHLNVNFDENEEGGTLIRGRYGPPPSIWTIFLLGYMALGLLFTFIAMFGLSKLALGQDAEILWILPLVFAAILTLWLFGQTGQKLGVEQTFRIHQFLEEAISEKIPIY